LAPLLDIYMYDIMEQMRVLGIESSCDETSASVVENKTRLLSNVVASSMDLHVKYGGVVPEIAARSHIEVIMPVVEQALSDAKCSWDEIDAIAVTYGAGLGGSLLIGVLAARTLAILKKKPLYGVNHVEAHLYANFLTETTLSDYELSGQAPEFPFMGLIVSGNHCQFAIFNDHFSYTLLGQTQDDAIGEAFDKVGKLLGLPYPGGISVSNKAKDGDPYKYPLPRAKLQGKYDFSFSGIKTAVLRLAQREIGEDFTFPSIHIAERLSEQQKADIAASFQRVALETITDKAVTAYQEFNPKMIIMGGGVAASPELRAMLSTKLPCPVLKPDRKLCTDNGAMTATLGSFKHALNQPQSDPYSLDIAPNLSM
jgi:N6-L-threonylcarbamoyladenine synthase